MADDQLNVRIVLDAAQLEGGMKAAAATVTTAADQMKDRFSSLASAAITSATANRELQGTLTTLARTGLVPTEEQVEEVAKAMFDATVATDALKSAQQEAYPALEQTARSANNARSAMMGLTNEIGLRGNRALSTFISQSETLGPILNTAFSGIAIVGFVQLAAQAAEKISTLISDTFIFTKAEKDVAAQIVKDNAEIQKAYDKHIAALREISLIGLSREAADQKRIEYARKDHAFAQQAVDTATQQVREETEKLNVLQKQNAERQKSFSYTGPGAAPQIDTSAQLKNQQAEVNRLNNELKKLQDALRASSDDLAKLNAVEKSDATKERTKDRKHEEEMERRNARAVRELVENIEREKLAQQSLNREQESFGASVAAKTAEEQTRAFIRLNEAQRQVADEQKRATEQEAVAEIAVRERQVQEELRLGQISTAQAREQLQALANQKLQIELDYVNDLQKSIQKRLTTEEKTDAEDLKAWQKLQADKLKAVQQFNSQIEKINEQTATLENKRWKELATSIGHNLGNAFRGLISGTETFSQAMARLADSILADLAEIPIRILENWLISLLGVKAAQTTSAVSQVASNAGVAASAAYASTAAIPIIGPELAPAAAAKALVEVLAFEGLASAAGGWDVPGHIAPSGALALLHPREMVLPAHLADAVRSGGGRQVHIHYNPTVNAIDTRGMKEALQQHGKDIVDILRQERRINGKSFDFFRDR